MKFKSILAAAAAIVLAAACTGQKVEGSAETKALLPSASQIDSASYLLGTNIGQWIKGNDFGQLNYSQFLKGIKDMVKAEGDPRDSTFGKQFRIAPDQIDAVMQSFMGKRSEYTKALNKEKGDAFLEANKAKDSIEVSESGLQYKILAPGNDVKPGPADTVKVRYKGTLLDGTVFDETKEDSDPVTLTLNRVIKGWQEGLQLVGEGGKIQLVIPGELAYGERGSQGIEPNSTLLFDVEVVEVHKVAPVEETPAE